VRQTITPTPQVAGADDDPYLYLQRVEWRDPGGDGVNSMWINAETTGTGKRFPPDLHHHPSILRSGHVFPPAKSLEA
jgi:hypothetical protein